MNEAHEQSRAVWGDMAAGWERHREYMWATTRHVAEWLVDRVEPREGDTILDLAGGAGDIGLLAAEKVAPSGAVIETDFAPQMVDVARRRVEQLGASNVDCRVLDAQKMELEDGSVDGILCRWGLMLMLDPAAALRECRRVLKSGRRLTFSVWGSPEKNPWITVTGMTMIQMGHQPGGDPFGPGGMFSLSDHDKIRTLLSEAGFAEVSVEEMPVEWRFRSFDESWSFMTQVAGALASAVKEMPSDKIEEFRSALEKNMEQFRTSDGISEPGVTINVAAS